MEDIEYAICVIDESAERRGQSAEEDRRWGGRERFFPWVMQEEGEA
jgi:hypothetical protein